MIRQKVQPDGWATYETMSILGEALTDQGKFADAEPLLTSGFEGMKLHQGEIPARESGRLNKAGQRLVKLYEAWGQKDKALKWRQQITAPPPKTAKIN